MDQKNNQFVEYLLSHIPLLDELYYFVTWSKDLEAYVTLLFSPLYNTFIKEPFNADIELSGHRFHGVTDQTVYLVPFDSDQLAKYEIKREQLVVTQPNGTTKEISYISEFSGELIDAPDLVLKIEEGKLYKYVHNQWEPVKFDQN
ncbi:MAG: hypothetical protein EBU46_06715 [Nitrosomonadaceae bacterium]|nr:hypothetical protein [Nitrosomonadaceae bacterium]